MVDIVVDNSTETFVTAKELPFLLMNCLSEGHLKPRQDLLRVLKEGAKEGVGGRLKFAF